jgi:hypothetical protein
MNSMSLESWTTSRGPALLLILSQLACGGPPTAGTDGGESGASTGGTDGSTAAPTSSGSSSTAAPTSGASDSGGVDPTTDGTTTSTSTTASTTASTGGDDTGPVFGDPIVVDPQDLEKWVWVPIPEMRCADGTSAGLMVNFTAQTRDLLLFFQGGGACWNQITCAAQPQSLAPWEADPWATWAADGGPVNGGIFDRVDPANPLRRHNFVYVPYCTGDGHLGDKVSDYGVHHVGYANATRAIERIVPTFTDATQIVVAGFSAGGMGATGNYHQIASAFESVGRESLVLINDAGPIMRPPFLSAATMDMLRDAWGLDSTIEPWCPSCVTEGYHTVYRTQIELHPGVRSSLLCSYNDSVVRLLYGALGSPIELGACEAGLRDLGDWRDQIAADVDPSLLREFYYFGERHGATENIPLADSPGLAEFLTAQLTADPNWTSVRP